MKSVIFSILLLIIILLPFTGCKKQVTLLSLPDLTDLCPMKVGKVYLYRLDSTKTSPFGTALITISYQAKDSIESRYTDATGRISYRIFRYIRDTLGLQPWIYTATYAATFDTNHIEFIDNNLRFISLVKPIANGTAWKGNSCINTILPSPFYFMNEWEYQYQNSDLPFTVLKGSINHTYTIIQQDQTNPSGPFDPAGYKERIYSIEVYAKGIGLIYKNFLHWTWQPTPYPACYQEDSYGISLNLIDYH